MRTSQAVKSLVYGVSTDDISHRHPAYLEAQTNMLTAETSGLHKRPPSVVINSDFLPTLGAGRHWVIKDFKLNQVRYYLCLNVDDTGTGLAIPYVYDDTGTSIAVTDAAYKLGYYVASLDTADDLDIAPYQDTIYITNRNETTAMKSNTRPSLYPSQIIFTKAPEENQVIVARWTGYGVGQKTTSVTALGADLATRGTDQMATLLGAEIIAASNPIEVLVTVTGSVVSILNRNTDSSTFCSVDDNGGGQYAIATNGVLESPTQLPRFAWDTDVIKIKPSSNSDKGAYYMKAIADGDRQSSAHLYPVRWEETSLQSLDWEIDETTMPHKMILDSTFSTEAPSWKGREAGDDDSNPLPAFIGNSIHNLAIFQNRLVATVNDTLVTTETDDHLMWFRDTVTQQLATQPVSVSSTSEASADIQDLIRHNKDLLLFSNEAQFKLDGSVPLTPQTAGIPLVTTFLNESANVAPLSLGSNVYFTMSYGNYTGIQKYRAGTTADIQDSADTVTDHVKKYLPLNPLKLLGNANLGILLAVYPDAIYVADYDAKRTEEVQRFAWSKWEGFDDSTGHTILEATLQGNSLQLLQSNLALVDITILPDPSVDDAVYLDWQMSGTILNGNSTFDASDIYNAATGNTICVEADTGARLPHTLTAGIVTLDTPVTADTDIVFGTAYECSMIPSRPVIRDQGGRINRWAKLSIVQWIANLVDSADVTASLISDYYTYADQYWSGINLFSLDAVINQVANTTDDFVVSFNNNPKHVQLKLWSKGHLPWNLAQLEWLGGYTIRGRRL